MPRLLIATLLGLGCLALAGLAAAPPLEGDRASGQASQPAPVPFVTGVERNEYDQVRWRPSFPLGRPTRGSLLRGVQLPAEGETFFTWDPIKKRTPNRAWRRWAADSTLHVLLRVLDEFRAAHPEAPRIGVGDLSRPKGGDFGVRFGPPGHASHQNGLDIDIYYPRRDRRERAPKRVGQIDRALSQDLVLRFVRAGAVYVFVGPRTGLTGPKRVVRPLTHHDNHLHARLRPRAR